MAPQQDNIGDGYRIPALEEFVQGFEFEVVDWTQPTGMFIPQGKGEAIQTHSFPKQWKPMKVTWMHDPNADVVIQTGEYTIHAKGSFVNFSKPFDVESWLTQGLIRVKISPSPQQAP